MAAPRANWLVCLREALAILFLAGVLAAAAYPFVGAPRMAAKQTTDPLAVSPAEVGRSSTPILWVDARKENERVRLPGLPGAVALNEDNWRPETLMLTWTPPQMVVVYCDGAGCQASRKVAERLAREMPALQARHLLGGLPAWREFEALNKGKATP